jgi:hypothetical protein
MKRMVLAIAATVALIATASAQAHPRSLPITKGKSAITRTARAIGRKAEADWSTVEGCSYAAGRWYVTCDVYWYFDGGASMCDEPMYASYAKRSSRVAVDADPRNITCAGDSGGVVLGP